MESKQDKRRELEMFDVDRENEFNLLGDSFYKYVEGCLLCHAPEIAEGEQRVLEAGCGTGAFGRHFIETFKERAAWSVTGVDIAPAMIEWNRRHPARGYDSMVGDLEDAALFAPESFDIVLCPMVLHHFPDPSRVVANLAAWLKPGGVFCIMEPNGSSPVSKFFKFGRHCVEKIMGLDYAKRFATVNETDHTMRRYVSELAANGVEARHRETRLVKSPPTHLIGRVRAVCDSVASVLPQPLRGNFLLVIAKKRGV